MHVPFTVEPGKDNNRLVVGAVPALPADIDLYLEKQQPDPDGSWAAVISGTSAELTHEGFTLSQPPTGTTGSRCTTGRVRLLHASM